MIKIISQHTSVTYSKFTPRISSLYSRSKFSKTISNPFKSKELLCWKEEMPFLNLRTYFENALKAFHVCWKAVRNNKRIAFVNKEGGLLAHPLEEGMNFIQKSRSRDKFPRFKALAWKKKSKRKQGNIMFKKLIQFMSMRARATLDQNKMEHDNHQYKLQAKVGRSMARLPMVSYGSPTNSFFSNTFQVLKTTFNPFLSMDLPNSGGSSLGSPKEVKGFSIDLNQSKSLPAITYDPELECFPNEYDERQKDIFDDLMLQNCLKDEQKLSFNLHLKQADLIFFSNPDRMHGLTNQVKKLGIPSIGIISGSKPSPERRGAQNLKDRVDYPIIGNADNPFFVLHIVLVFYRLLQKAHNKDSKPYG
jgi:hypothetical protein